MLLTQGRNGLYRQIQKYRKERFIISFIETIVSLPQTLEVQDFN